MQGWQTIPAAQHEFLSCLGRTDPLLATCYCPFFPPTEAADLNKKFLGSFQIQQEIDYFSTAIILLPDGMACSRSLNYSWMNIKAKSLKHLSYNCWVIIKRGTF